MTKIANFIDDTSNEPSKFRIKNWVEMNDESRETYIVNNQIKFKTAMIKSGFKSVINRNKYLSKSRLLKINSNLNHLLESSFQGINRLFVLAFENDTQRRSQSGYYLPNLEVKDYNIMINGEKFFDQPLKSNKVTYENIRKTTIGKGDDYITGCLLNYPYFKDSYKMIAVDLSKQHALDGDPRPNQQINFTANLLDFSKGAVKVL